MSAEQTNPSQAEIEARMDARAKEYQQRVDELRATQRVSSETGKILFPAPGDFGRGQVWTIAPYEP